MRKEGGNGSSSRFESKTASEFMNLGALPGQSVEAAMRAGNAWLRGIGSLNEEIMTFSQEQFGKCVEAQQSLMRCSSMDQAFSTQCDIARNTIESCYREANKLLSLSNEIAREAWMPAASGRSETTTPSVAAVGED